MKEKFAKITVVTKQGNRYSGDMPYADKENRDEKIRWFFDKDLENIVYWGSAWILREEIASIEIGTEYPLS